jgi:hypothetical protein
VWDPGRDSSGGRINGQPRRPRAGLRNPGPPPPGRSTTSRCPARDARPPHRNGLARRRAARRHQQRKRRGDRTQPRRRRRQRSDPVRRSAAGTRAPGHHLRRPRTREARCDGAWIRLTCAGSRARRGAGAGAGGDARDGARRSGVPARVTTPRWPTPHPPRSCEVSGGAPQTRPRPWQGSLRQNRRQFHRRARPPHG